MKKILVTAIGGDVGYGIIKSIKKSNYDLYIIGCDIKKYNCSYDLVDEFHSSPAYGNKDEWWNFILKLILRNKIDIFWPVTEPEIKIVNEQKLKLHNVKIIMNSSYILEIAMDKLKTAEFLSKAGIFTPRTWGRLEACLFKYPLVVKEKFGCGSYGVKLVDSKKELTDAIKRMRDPIIQEYIGNESEEYTLTVFSDGQVVNFICFRRTLGFEGMSKFIELVYSDKLEEIAYKIAKIFNLRGSINIQMRKQDEIFYVFEINPRISSTIGFRSLLGFNDVTWWIDLVEGKKLKKYEYPNEKVYGVRSVEEKIFFVPN